MGDLSGPWLLETDGQPVRFVDSDGDTLTLAVGREPLMLRQGPAASDTSIVVEVAGLFVSGAMRDAKSMHGRPTEAELVTAGPSAGTLTIRASTLSFLGHWDGRAFSGHFRVDLARAGADVRTLDPQRAWTLRRLDRAGGTSH
jgi:hypothetical protein